MKTENEIKFVYNMLSAIIKSNPTDIHRDDVLNIIIMADSLEWVLSEDGGAFAESIVLIREHFYGAAN